MARRAGVISSSDAIQLVEGQRATETDTANAGAVHTPSAIKAGSFRSRSTTGVDSVTGLSFTPMAVVIAMELTDFSDTTLGANISYALLISDGTTTRCIGAHDTDNVGTTTTSRWWTSTLRMADASAATITDGSISFTADGFEINWTTIASSWSVCWWAIGGYSVDAKVLTFSRTGTGSASLTGAGFQPKALIGIGGNNVNVESAINGSSLLTLGVGDDDADAASVGIQMQDAQTAANTSRRHSTSGIFAMDDAAASAQELAVALTSLDADGFTVDTTALPGTRFFAVLCLGGPGINATEIVTLTANATIGANTQTISGLPFEPNGGLAFGVGAASVGGSTTARITVGGFDDDLDQWGALANSNDTSDPTLTSAGASNTSVLYAYSGTDEVIKAAGEITAKDSDSIDVTWAASKTATQFVWSSLLFDLAA